MRADGRFSQVLPLYERRPGKGNVCLEKALKLTQTLQNVLSVDRKASHGPIAAAREQTIGLRPGRIPATGSAFYAEGGTSCRLQARLGAGALRGGWHLFGWPGDGGRGSGLSFQGFLGPCEPTGCSVRSSRFTSEGLAMETCALSRR